jgi:hypothetical protein
MDADLMASLPIVDYDAIAADYRARGVDLSDMMGSGGDFERWRRRLRLPAKDPEGVHHGSSQVYFRRYQEDPQGAAACPAKVNFWHWLLEASKPVPWTEQPGRRVKLMPLAADVFTSPPDPTEEEMAAGRARLEARSGPLPEDAWAQFARSVVDTRVEARRSVEIVREVVARYGVPTPTDYGPMVLVRMSVGC